MPSKKKTAKKVVKEPRLSAYLKKLMAERAELWEKVHVQIVNLPIGVYEIEVKEVLWCDISWGVDGTDTYVVAKDQEGRVLLLSEETKGLGSRYNIKVGKKLKLTVAYDEYWKQIQITECEHSN